MKLQIQIGSEEPKLFPINKDKLQIGASEASDIHLPANAGISRKHLTLTVESDKIFICDMGSTNGTFINEERLQPGTKEEFTSFFPAKLGDSVYISLITDDDAVAPVMPVYEAPRKEDKSSGATKTVALSEVNKTGTKTKNITPEKEDPKKRARPLVIGQKKDQGPSDSSRMTMTIAIVAGMIGMAVFYNFYLSPPEGEGEIVQEQGPVKEKLVKEADKPAAPPTPQLVPVDKAPAIDQISKAFVDFKCSTVLEKKLCELVPDASMNPGGVLENMDHILILVPEDKWYAETFKVVYPDMPNRIPFTPDKRTTYLALFFLKAVPAFNWDEIEKNIFLVFYRTKDKAYVSSIVGLVPKEITKLLKEIPANLVQAMTEKPGGHYKIDELGKFMRVVKPTDEINPPPPPPAVPPTPATTPQITTPAGSGAPIQTPTSP